MTFQSVDQVFGFGQLIYCEVIMWDFHYQVLFNNESVAELQMNDDMEWMLTSGVPLPNSIINEIGHRIENRYL